MNRFRFTLLILFTLLTNFAAQSQNVTLPKEVGNLTLRDGLPHNGVSSMLLDSKGYLWIGTYDGVARYNSHTIKNIEFEDEEYALVGRRTRSLAEDSNGNIWIGSDAGILKIDRESDKTQELPLYHFDNISRNNFAIIKLFNVESKGLVYAIAEKFGLLIYDLNGNLKSVAEIPRDSGITIFDAAIDSQQRLLVTTNKGLFVYDAEVAPDFTKVLGISENNFSTLLFHSDDRLLLAPNIGLYDGAVTLNAKTKRYTYESSQKLIGKEMVRTLLIDDSGALWVGTRTDGIKYIPNFDEGSRHLYNLRSGERVSEIVAQGDDEMWVATFDHGLFRYSKSSEIFTNIADVVDHNFDMSRFSMVDTSHLLINTIHRNSYLYEIDKGQLSPTPDYLRAIPAAKNRTSLRSPDGRVWILTDTPFWLRIDPSGEWRKIQNKTTKALSKSAPIASAVDNDGNIWCGYSNNLYRIKIDKRGYPTTIESVKEHPLFANRAVPRIRTIYVDPKQSDVVWVGTTTDGLLKIETSEESVANMTIENYDHRAYDSTSLPSNFVSSILRDSEGQLWVGTEHGGVCRLVGEEDNTISFEQISRNDGLTNNVVKSLVEDNDGNLWISTNYGLNRLNIKERTIFVYHEDDGLPFEQFWYDSELLPSGELIFSGVNGVLRFHPQHLSKSKEAPNLEFSEFQLLNETIKPRERYNGRVLLDKRLSDESKIRLKYNENIITVGVDVIHTSIFNSSQIRYQLLPLSEEWISVPSQMGAITLSGVESGDYELNVMAVDALGQKSPTKSLHIKIAPHPLRSAEAIIIYIIVVLLIVWAIISSLLHVTKLNHNLMLERIKKRNAERLNEEKQRYFTNISHELKTPLTLILAPANALAQRFRFDVDITSKVEVIKRQSNRMLQLIDSTHKLNLDELNILEPQNIEFEFDAFMTELVDDFKFLAEQENKLLEIEGEPAYVEGDKILLEMAICNILNNAFKYTKSGDKISLSYKVVDGSVVMRITDTGAGISEEDLPRIFERFYRGTEAMKQRLGTGVGLSFTKRLIELHLGHIEVNSKLGVGASFTITLPIILTPTAEIAHAENTQIEEEDSIILDLNSDVVPNISEEIRGSMVYVVEDNDSMRTMIVEALEPYFRVRSFESGESCLKQMESAWAQIVISDVMMEGMSGYTLCQKIKESLSTSHIPVILLTGLSSVDDKIKGLEAGADAYIYKPFYVNHLLTRVERLLRGREELRKRFEAGIPVELGESRAMSQLDNDFIDRLYALFDTNLDNEQIDMDYIASELYISRAALYQKIKAVMGNTPYELLKNYRLTRAADLLQQGGGVNINDVCLMTGFKNRAHFSRVFKERYGVSPSKYVQKREVE